MDLQVLSSYREPLRISHSDDFALLEELSEGKYGHLIGQQVRCEEVLVQPFPRNQRVQMNLQVLGSYRELLCISHSDDFALLEELSEEEYGHLIGQQVRCEEVLVQPFPRNQRVKINLQVLGSYRAPLCISHSDDFALLEELSEEECGHLIGQQARCFRSVELLVHHAKCYLVLLD